MPVALRGPEPACIRGLSGLKPADHERLVQGNKLADWTARVVRLCCELNIAVVVENPANSLLWLYPPLARLLKTGTPVILDQCAFGASWRKATRLHTWNCNLSALGIRCRASKGLCQFSGEAHHNLTGTSPSGAWRTSAAAAYPAPLCQAICEELAPDGQFLGGARTRGAKPRPT